MGKHSLFKRLKKDIWNRCMYCGRFIGHEEFYRKTAINKMVTPESDVSSEYYETYHIKCKEKHE